MKDNDTLGKLTGEGGAEIITSDGKVMIVNYQQISLCVIVETISCSTRNEEPTYH